MNLDNFQKEIDDVIVERGWNYYQDDCIKSIVYEQGLNIYSAIVAGTDDYNVTVELKDKEVLALSCDCPYDMGPFCKHQVAVLYKLKEIRKDNKTVAVSDASVNLPTGPDKSRSHLAQDSPGDRYTDIISSQPKERLVELLASLCLENPEIASRVNFEFDSTQDPQKRSIDLIRSSIRQHSDRHGFIEYSDAFGASEGARMVIQTASDAAYSEDYASAANMYLCVLHEMVPLLESADDSNGAIGATIEDALTGLGALFENSISEDFAEELFDTLLKESTNRIYDGWSDWVVVLLERCATLAFTLSRKKRLEQHIDSFGKDSPSSRYLIEQLAQISYRLTLQFDGEEKAAEFIERKMDFPHFREMAINKALSTGDYDRVIKLALDGEKHDSSLAGLINKWKGFRYEAYSLSEQMESQRMLAMEFILDGHFDYYRKLKFTYTKQAWLSVYPGIIQNFETKRNYSSIYPRILVEEHELQKLLEYVKASPKRIADYHQRLFSDFGEEVYAIWTQYILSTAQRASNRRDYQDVCSLIKVLIEDGGTIQASLLISQLLSAYPRKTAFREELRKIAR